MLGTMEEGCSRGQAGSPGKGNQMESGLVFTAYRNGKICLSKGQCIMYQRMWEDSVNSPFPLVGEGWHAGTSENCKVVLAVFSGMCSLKAEAHLPIHGFGILSQENLVPQGLGCPGPIRCLLWFRPREENKARDVLCSAGSHGHSGELYSQLLHGVSAGEQRSCYNSSNEGEDTEIHCPHCQSTWAERRGTAYIPQRIKAEPV